MTLSPLIRLLAERIVADLEREEAAAGTPRGVPAPALAPAPAAAQNPRTPLHEHA